MRRLTRAQQAARLCEGVRQRLDELEQLLGVEDQAVPLPETPEVFQGLLLDKLAQVGCLSTTDIVSLVAAPGTSEWRTAYYRIRPRLLVLMRAGLLEREGSRMWRLRSGGI